MIIREANDSDLDAVLTVERKAFGKDEEADLVGDLLKDPTAKPLLSLLAFHDEKAVGHILFTKACLEPKADLLISILAPLAILPEYQKQGIGGKLIRAGLEMLADQKVDLVFVLGDPNYYTRHGFRPVRDLGFAPPHALPEIYRDAWMVQELQPDVLGKQQGKVLCAETLNKPRYWTES